MKIYFGEKYHKNLNNHILYHPNGQVKEEGSYYIDQIGIYDIEEFQVPVGEWKGWYENGHKEYIEQFNDQGKNEGIFVYWNEHGVKTKRMVFTKMDKNMALLNYGMKMENYRKRPYILMVKKMV